MGGEIALFYLSPLSSPPGPPRPPRPAAAAPSQPIRAPERPGPLQNQHGIPIAVEPVPLPHGPLVGGQEPLPAKEGGDQEHEA